MEATGKILGWLFIAAIVYTILRGSAGKYLAYLGI